AISTALARFAQRLHGVAGTGHHVASPLGVWLLLALCGRCATGTTRAQLSEVLGVDVDTAAGVAAALLDDPHALVGSAAALWHRPAGAGSLSDWLAGLPDAVRTGDLPSQEQADAWAREHTLGLIERFPLALAPDVLLVLATALATRVSWEVPFDPVPAGELGPGSAWAGQLGTVLRSPGTYAHEQYIAATARAGDVAVHTAQARPAQVAGERHGLAVTSVIADPGVAPADVLAAAYELATGGQAARRSLFDLPLGGGPMWTLSERPAPTTAPDGREERCTAVLPAWSATSEHDLDHDGLGLPAAARALAAVLGLGDYLYVAKQSAVARYSRFGFEAAAVSALAVTLGFQEPREGLLRVADLRFGHPFAVVAVATRRHPDGHPVPWHGLPVFSAWITEVEDAGAAE
ncbi:MAG: hypothetical protein V7603_3299, partial [Micromonosporaceae bacterium]